MSVKKLTLVLDEKAIEKLDGLVRYCKDQFPQCDRAKIVESLILNSLPMDVLLAVGETQHPKFSGI